MPAAQVVQNSPNTAANAAAGGTTAKTTAATTMVTMDDSAGFLDEIQKLKETKLETGEKWFVVDCHWYEKMTDFLQGNGDFPGPIDNSGLFRDGSMELREGLQDELDYVLIPEEAWNKLREKFGLVDGQEPISRKVILAGVFVHHTMVEIYPLQINLSLHSDPENVITVQSSRSATPTDLKKEARARFHLGSGVQIRLYQKVDTELELIPESKSRDTLHDLCLTGQQKQNIVVDVEENGKWNIEEKIEQYGSMDTRARPGTSGAYRTGAYSMGNKIASGESTGGLFGRGLSSGSGTPPQTTPGLCGLSNLGNTCFMNSALQCMVNAGPLTDYFLSDKHKDEINEDNPLGMHGEIAQTFGELVKQMWSGRHTSVIPRAFKSTVGRFAPQFSGYQQQDSQELMAFLLDGLHEDLNRVRKKPYVEIKDSDGKPDEEVATEAWSNYKKRNDSIIVDLFHGLLKSTVVCPECDKISVTFDPFCYLSLPLPGKKDRQIVLNYVPLNSSISIQKCKVTVSKSGTVKDILDAVVRQFNVANNHQLVACEIYTNKVYKIYDPDSLVSTVMDRDAIFVYEVEVFPQSDDPKLVVLYNRTQKQTYLSFQWNLTGVPMVTSMPKANINYENLKRTAERVFERFITPPLPDALWWRPDNDSDSGVEENGDNGAAEQENNAMDTGEGSPAAEGPPQLYTLRVVNGQGNTDFEEVKPSVQPTMLQHSGEHEIYVALDWHPVAGEKFLDTDHEQYIKEHESLGDTKVQKKSMMSLDECLDLFTTTEKLGEHDLWYCPRCKKHQQATKKFDLWSLPEIMIIHLKRFSYTRYWRDKIEGTVDYPLRDLDLSKWVINKNHKEPLMYDLTAVSNHYGGLGGGHYTAYGRNKITGKWYNFDDSSVGQMGEDVDVVTKSGYVLVYARRHNVPKIEPHTDPNVEMEED